MQVVSLGIHVIEVGAEAYRMLLMEVMPSVLARRTFPPPRTAAQLEPGFRDAPDPAHHLAILFMKARAAECTDVGKVLFNCSTLHHSAILGHIQTHAPPCQPFRRGLRHWILPQTL